MKLTEAIEKLKSGIVNGDEELIEEGFFLLTGETVIFPEEDGSQYSAERNTPMVAEVVTKDEKVFKGHTSLKSEDFTMNKEKVVAQTRNFVNNFNPNIKADKEEGGHLLNDNVAPTQRTRGEFKMATVFCQDCSKTIEVNPQFKREPYNCDLIKCGQPCPNAK
jgi:hypothetical protein